MASTKIVWESPALESLFYILNVPSALLANCFIPIWQHWNNKDLSYNLCCVVGCIYSRVNRHSGNSLWQFVLWSHTPVFKKQHSPWQLHKRDIFRFIYSPLPSTVSIKHTAESKTISSRSHLSMDVSPFFHITSELDFRGGHNSRGGCGIFFLRETRSAVLWQEEEMRLFVHCVQDAVKCSSWTGWGSSPHCPFCIELFVCCVLKCVLMDQWGVNIIFYWHKYYNYFQYSDKPRAQRSIFQAVW